MPSHAPRWALGTLVLVALACGAPAQNPPTPAVSPAAPLFTPTPTPPPPLSLSEAVTDGVDSGAWSRADGLILMLRYLAGELTIEEAFGDRPPESDEGTGVVRQAFDYLEDPANVEGREEIERLLTILIPSRLTLDRFARPAPAAGRGPGTARSPQRPVGDEADCRDLWSSGFDDAAPVVCLEYAEFVIGGNAYRVYYPAYWDAADPRRALLEPTTTAVRDSVEAYNRYGPASVITADVVFTELAFLESDGRRTDNVLAVASPDEGRSRCYVAIFPSAASEPTSLPFVLAHELFHCYQYTNLSPQESGPPPEVNEWWVEGSANYFASVVYPANNFEWEYAGWFDRRSERRSLLRLSYDNYLFFQYLALQQGFQPEGIVELLRRMPASGGPEDQQNALASVGGIEDLFHAFGQAYLDRDLLDSGGGKVPVEPQPGPSFAFGIGPADEEFAPEAFRLERARLVFAEETRFTTETEAPGSGLLRARPIDSPGGWSDPPAELNTACGESVFVLLTTHAAPAGASSARFALHVEGEEPDAETECDRCLIGGWQLDLASYIAGYDALAPSLGGAPASIEEVSGSVEMNISEAGSIYSRIDGLYVRSLFEVGGRPAQLELKINGASSSLYVVRPLGTLTTTDPVESIEIEARLTVDGREAEAPLGGPPAPGAISGTYVCEGDTLHITPIDVGVPHPGLDYIRLP